MSGERVLGGRRVESARAMVSTYICCSCAAVGVIVDEECAADEGGSVRAGVEAGVGFIVWNFQASSCQPVSRALS